MCSPTTASSRCRAGSGIPIARAKSKPASATRRRRPLQGLRFEALDAAQAYLDRWETRWADTRIHGTTKRQVAAMFAEEQPALGPLPIEPFRYYPCGARAMLVKFLAHGTGSAQAAADYLTRELDSQGEVRADVAVLRGDPDDVAAVADALEFDHKYTSGVIAWAPENQPSDQDIDRVLDEVEQTAWAGLAPDHYAWAAVRHRDADGGVHVLAARCDLETGKSLNIAPPGWEQTYGPFISNANTYNDGASRHADRSWPCHGGRAGTGQSAGAEYHGAVDHDRRVGVAPPRRAGRRAGAC